MITSADGKVTCTLGGTQNVTVPAHGNAQQPCATPLKAVPAESWNQTIGPLTYTGSSPAGGSTAGYTVPAGCGDPTPAKTAAQQALQGKVATPSGDVVFSGPSYAIDSSSLSCSPGAGTQQSGEFTYVQQINGSVAESVYALSDLQSALTKALQAAVPQNYALLSTQICPSGPKTGSDASSTRATITCAASATVGWAWTPASLLTLAQSIAGSATGPASLQLNQTQGIAPASVKITLKDGSELPKDPAAITFVVTP